MVHPISVISSYTLVWPSVENNFLSGKATQKSRSRELFTDETTEKDKKYHTGSDKKATNFGLKLFNGTPKFNYKFKEIISLMLPYVKLIM